MSSFVITDKVWLCRRGLHRRGSTLFRWCVEAVGSCVLLFTCQRSGTQSADGFIAQRDYGLQSYEMPPCRPAATGASANETPPLTHEEYGLQPRLPREPCK